MATLAVNLIARTKIFEKGMRNATRSLGRLSKGAHSARQKLARLAKGLLVAAGAGGMIYAITRTVKSYAEFEKQMAMVSTMLDKQAMVLMPKYTKQLKLMAVEFGESTETLSKGLYDILSASVAPAQALDVLAASVKAGKAGMTDAGTAAYALTGVMNAYGIAAEKVREVSDILFTIQKKGMTTFGQFAGVIGRVTSIAATAGVSLGEVAAALATITRGGISTEEAITGLKSAILTLQGRAEGGIKVAKLHGIELSVQALKTKGLIKVVQQLSKLNPEVFKQIVKEVRARVALTRLITDQAGFVSDYEATLKSAGTTQEQYEKMTDTLSHTFARFKQSVKVLSVTIGNYLAPGVKLLTNYFAKTNQTLTTFLEANRAKISAWAERTAARIIFVKDVIGGFVSYLGKDFLGGIKFGLDAALEQFKVFGKSLLAVMEKIFTDIGLNIGRWLFNANQWRAARAFVRKNILEEMGYEVGPLGTVLAGGKTKRAVDWAKSYAEKEAERIVSTYGPEASGFKLKPMLKSTPWQQIGQKILQFQEEANKKIADMAPPEILQAFKDAQEKLSKQLQALAKKYGKKDMDAYAETLSALKKSVEDKAEKTAATQVKAAKRIGEFKEIRPRLISIFGLTIGKAAGATVPGIDAASKQEIARLDKANQLHTKGNYWLEQIFLKPSLG